MTHLEYVDCFKALADPTRLQIVKYLEGCTKCACKLLEEFNITQPTLSYHMKQLVTSGIVNVSKEGTWNHYSLNIDVICGLKDFFDNTNMENSENCNCGCHKK
ncbi:MAG: metalloregulator ArsR/SmtB family transcription factor [Clostridia bacterium]